MTISDFFCRVAPYSGGVGSSQTEGERRKPSQREGENGERGDLSTLREYPQHFLFGIAGASSHF
jgi:hypothetical protein